MNSLHAYAFLQPVTQTQMNNLLKRHNHKNYKCTNLINCNRVCTLNKSKFKVKRVKTRSSAIAEGPHDALVSTEKLAIDECLDIHPRSSQLLLLNGHTAYHFLFVNVVSTSLSRAILRHYF